MYILLYIQLGYSVLLSAVIIVILLPTQYFIGAILAGVQKKVIVSVSLIMHIRLKCLYVLNL